jgi:hypothetical protein
VCFCISGRRKQISMYYQHQHQHHNSLLIDKGTHSDAKTGKETLGWAHVARYLCVLVLHIPPPFSQSDQPCSISVISQSSFISHQQATCTYTTIFILYIILANLGAHSIGATDPTAGHEVLQPASQRRE